MDRIRTTGPTDPAPDGEQGCPATPLDPAVTGARRGLADAGMATAEYAIATIAAVGFAGLLIVVLKSDGVKGLLTGLVETALSIG